MNKKELSFINGGDDTFSGFESISVQTLAIPYVTLIQKNSRFFDPGSYDFIKDVKPGLFINSVNGNIYGDNFNFSVLKFDHIFQEWNGENVVGIHSIEVAQKLAVDKTFGSWRTENGNYLIEKYVYYIIIEGHENEGLILLSLRSSSISAGKTLNRMCISGQIINGKKVRPYYMVFNAFNTQRENDKGSWRQIGFKFSHYVNEEQYKIIKKERGMLPENTKALISTEEENNFHNKTNNNQEFIPEKTINSEPVVIGVPRENEGELPFFLNDE